EGRVGNAPIEMLTLRVQPLDLLSHAGDFALGLEHIRELAGPRPQHIDETSLRVPRLREPRLHVDDLPTDVLRLLRLVGDNAERSDRGHEIVDLRGGHHHRGLERAALSLVAGDVELTEPTAVIAD